MPDRVRETIFNLLGNHFGCPGSLPELRVADVFAGGGSMGLEALSRGAAHSYFYENSRSALAALRANVDSLGAADRSTIITRDAWRHVLPVSDSTPFELVFFDPPYRDSQDSTESGPVQRYLARLANAPAQPQIVVFHYSSQITYEDELAGGWRTMERRTIGTNCLSVLTR